MSLYGDFLDLLEESDLIEDKSAYSADVLSDSVKFFKAWGFKEVHAMDVSSYENADIIFNLNDDLPEELCEKFDVIFDGGVIEHVFDVSKALNSICKMAKVGGVIFNINPIANCLYNTFWNISPELFTEFYRLNGYKILECSAMTFLTETREIKPWAERPVIWSPDARILGMIHPLLYGEHIRSLYKIASNPLPHTFIVAKKTNSNDLKSPITSGYRKKHAGIEEPWLPKVQ